MLQMTSLLGGAFGALYATNMGGPPGLANYGLQMPVMKMTIASLWTEVDVNSHCQHGTSTVGKQHHLELEGWRAAFVTVAIISFVIGVC